MACLDDFPQITVGDAIVFHGSNLDVLPFMADNSVDSIVCDPPYELGFMGKKWDSSGIAFTVELWAECFRVLKHGGHLLAFGGTRTYHRMAVAIEDAGFDLRDSIAWLYGSGFPKSHDVSKAIDKAAGAEREVIETIKKNHFSGDNYSTNEGWARPSHRNPDGTAKTTMNITAPATDDAKKWAGWGTALKPAFEPVVVARKPLVGTVAENVLAWGVGGLNIDASRIGTDSITINTFDNGAKPFGDAVGEPYSSRQVQGRWPANIILDEYTAGLLDEQSENVSRFFYVAKASKRDRNEGDVPNTHPTVKPTDLMRYLIKLVTPDGGLVLDPFTGSGSTGKAALLDGYRFIGIELTEDYLPIIDGRLRWAEKQRNDVAQAANSEIEKTLF
jgi:DNA modification methylase